MGIKKEFLQKDLKTKMLKEKIDSIDKSTRPTVTKFDHLTAKEKLEILVSSSALPLRDSGLTLTYKKIQGSTANKNHFFSSRKFSFLLSFF